MTSISEIARDPHKALKSLEKDLGVREGTLMREMQELADEIGDWTQHIPYTLAAGYYDEPATRERYQTHVDGCDYCQHLLESLHPSDLQATEFARSAACATPSTRGRRRASLSLPFAMVASALIAAVASFFAIPKLQTRGILPGAATARPLLAASSAPDPNRANIRLLAAALLDQPNRLIDLQDSTEPAERFLAAKYYFAANKPKLAYQELGEGLKLAGVQPVDAQKIKTVEDLPSDKSAAAEDLARALQQLPHSHSKAPGESSTDFLQIAQAQARLGLHEEALASIERYLKTQRDIDPKIVTEFSSIALSKPLTCNTLTANNAVACATSSQAELASFDPDR